MTSIVPSELMSPDQVTIGRFHTGEPVVEQDGKIQLVDNTIGVQVIPKDIVAVFSVVSDIPGQAVSLRWGYLVRVCDVTKENSKLITGVVRVCGNKSLRFSGKIFLIPINYYAEGTASKEARISLWSPTTEKRVRISIRQ